MTVKHKIEAAHDRPIIFRTTSSEVYWKMLKSGSIWLRSSKFYRETEDIVRHDAGEGVNGTGISFPLIFKPAGGTQLHLEGKGKVGREIIPHYIVCLHGVGVSQEQRKLFGGCTVGIRDLARLSAEVLYQASLQVDVNGYRYGQVSYQQTPLVRSYASSGEAISLDGKPPEFLRSLNTDVLRKDPVEPFILQDEWKIAIFTKDVINDDPNVPLKINVDPGNFYPYIDGK